MMVVAPSKTLSCLKCLDNLVLIFEESSHCLIATCNVCRAVLICQSDGMLYRQHVSTRVGIVCNNPTSSLSGKPFPYHPWMSTSLLCQLLWRQRSSCSCHSLE